jgi:hypothetical protein
MIRVGGPAIVLVAAVAALAPLPAASVERWYSLTIYPRVQAVVTSVTNVVPFALFDLAVAALLAALIVWLVRTLRMCGWRRAAVRAIVPALTLTAVLYLVFLVLWGFNYRRVPLEQKIEFSSARVTKESLLRLGATAVRTLNATYAPAHATTMGEASLEEAFASAQSVFGSRRLARPGVLKRSLLELYFRYAAIDGMTDPYFLEVIVNPDTLPFERPFVILHEWGHLAGYAVEAEANLFAWVACLRGDALARYSGWLTIYEHAAAQLPRADRAALAAQLESGPREDLNLSAARYARSLPVVRTAARDVYDSYLRANRVDKGIQSYDDVVRLILGAGIDDGRAPQVRASY